MCRETMLFIKKEHLIKNIKYHLGIMANACNPSTWEAETGGL
jgi:hypothetical protein